MSDDRRCKVRFKSEGFARRRCVFTYRKCSLIAGIWVADPPRCTSCLFGPSGYGFRPTKRSLS